MAVISTTANSPIDICARALILIGADPITSFDEDTTEALVASNMYEDVARASLVNSRWRFATNQAVLNCYLPHLLVAMIELISYLQTCLCCML